MYFKVDITGYFVLLKVGKINLLILTHWFKVIKPKFQFWLIPLRAYFCTKMSIWTHSGGGGGFIFYSSNGQDPLMKLTNTCFQK